MQVWKTHSAKQMWFKPSIRLVYRPSLSQRHSGVVPIVATPTSQHNSTFPRVHRFHTAKQDTTNGNKGVQCGLCSDKKKKWVKIWTAAGYIYSRYTNFNTKFLAPGIIFRPCDKKICFSYWDQVLNSQGTLDRELHDGRLGPVVQKTISLNLD